MIDPRELRGRYANRWGKHKLVFEAADEIERLRASAEIDARLRQTCLELRDEARQENKRLRIALKEITEYAPLEWHGMRARRALEEAGMQREA